MKPLSYEESIDRWLDHLSTTLVTMILTFNQDVIIKVEEIKIRIVHSTPPNNIFKRLVYTPTAIIIVDGIFFRYIKECVIGCPLEIRNLKNNELVDVQALKNDSGTINVIHDECMLIERTIQGIVNDKYIDINFSSYKALIAYINKSKE